MRIKTEKAHSLQQKTARYGWIFISPFLLGFLLVYGEVIINSIVYSFCKITPGVSGFTKEFTGWENIYYVLFVNNGFVRMLLNSIVTMVTEVPIVIIFSLFIATLLNQKMRGRAVFRAIFFIPAVLITGIVAQSGNNALMDVMQSGEAIHTGMGNELLETGSFVKDLLSSAALSDTFSQYIVDAIDNIFAIVNNCGVQILIFIAALQSISSSLYESAKIDGATGWDCYWKITFPMISPMIMVNVVFSIVDSFVSESNPVMTVVYQLGIRQGNVGTASALAWMYFLVVIVLLCIVLLLTKLFVYYQQKE